MCDVCVAVVMDRHSGGTDQINVPSLGKVEIRRSSKRPGVSSSGAPLRWI